MRGVRIYPVARSFAAARNGTLKKFDRAAAKMAAAAEFEFGAVAVTYSERSPMATGEMSEACHVIAVKQEGKSFVTGVGVRMLPNGHEVIAEAQQMSNLHTAEHEHDPAGFRCSTGVQGGWGDSYEQENVREMRGGLLRSNPRARQWPLGAAIVERLGPLVTESQAARFARGVRNIYRTGAGIVKNTRLGMVLKRASNIAMKAAIIAVFVFSTVVLAGSPSPTPWVVRGLAVSDARFEPTATKGKWYDSDPFPIGAKANTNTTQYFSVTMCLDTFNTASPGMPDSVFGYVVTKTKGGSWNAVQWDKSAGDTLWIVDVEHAISDTGCFVLDLPILAVGADSAKMWWYFAGDTCRLSECQVDQIR